MTVPARPKIYHIVHLDNLASIVADGGLLSDADMANRNEASVIGMSGIKQRRRSLQIHCRPGLFVGDCVPFYFCPRSIMVYIIHCANHPNLSYQGGQAQIVHLEFDMREIVEWAENNSRRWAFTLSNAGANYFEDSCDLARLEEINWDAVSSNRWSGPGVERSIKEGKQAEFLVETRVPWRLIRRIGVHSQAIAAQVAQCFGRAERGPTLEIRPDWYY